MTYLTPQIKRITQGTWRDYLEMVGDGKVGPFLAYEIYELLFKRVGGALGLILRNLILPFLIDMRGKRVLVEDGVSFIGAKRISLGERVIISKYCTVEARDGGQIELQDNVFLNKYTTIVCKGGKIVLGRAVNISSHSRLGTSGVIAIGESCLVSSHCYIGAPNHNLDDPARTIEEKVLCKGVTIGPRVWIGSHVTVLDGVSIGEDSIIGAHSFVNKDIPKNSIAFGVPAKVVRERTSKPL